MSDQFGYPEQRATQPGEASGESLAELLTRYWVLFKKYYWVLILTSMVGVAAAYVWTERQPRIYQATSKLIFNETQPNVLGRDFEQVQFVQPGNRWQFEEFWNTQREVLSSNWFAERVVDREGLADDPRLFPEDREGPALTEEERHRVAVGRVQGATNYSLQRDSRVGLVEVRFRDPELAAQVADAIAETYVEYIQAKQSGGLEQLSSWFEDYVSAQREELDASHAELQEYQQQHSILSLSYEDRRRRTQESLDSVTNRLLDVRDTLSEQRALLHQIEEMERSEGDLRALADLVEHSALSNALSREAELKEERAELSARYLDDHPRVREVDERLAMVQQTIDDEIGRIRSSVQNRAAVTERYARSLEADEAALIQEVAELDEIGVEYTQLRESTETLRQHYETVLGRTTEIDLNALWEHDIIQVLEHAEVPGAPVSPQVPLNLAIGLLMGLFLGGAIMVFVDALDNTVKSQEQIAAYTDRPLLGMLPSVNKSALRGVETFGDSALDTLAHTAPRSSFSEGIKTIRTNLMFMAPDNPPKVLLMTSPGPGEGKTLTAINMAIAFAQSGEKTVIIDTDMRRPRVHKALGIKNDQGLSEVLADEAELSEIIRDTEIGENFDVITCGTVPPNPSELLHTDEFRKTVDELRKRYDRVIFDSPPLAAVTDALILSHSVDNVLLMVKFGQTRQELLARSIEQLEAIGAPLAGIVFNDVDDSSGYGYAYYYRYRYDEPGDLGRDDDRDGRERIAG